MSDPLLATRYGFVDTSNVPSPCAPRPERLNKLSNLKLFFDYLFVCSGEIVRQTSR